MGLSGGNIWRMIRILEKAHLIIVLTTSTTILTVLYLTLSLLNPWRGIIPFDARGCIEANPSKIPKLIHRIWDRGVIPDTYKDYLNNCHKLNPDYKEIIWNASALEDFMKSNYPWAMTMYYQYPTNILRYNAARYFVIYHYGGIYLDMDMDCHKSFKFIMDAIESTVGTKHNVILGEAVPTGIVSNFFISQPESQFFTQVIHNLENTKDEKFPVPVYEQFVKSGTIFLWKNYLNFPCKDQVYVLEKFKVRREWLKHDGAALWMKRGSSSIFMGVTTIWANNYYTYNRIMLVMCVSFIIYMCRKIWHKRPCHNFLPSRPAPTKLM